MTLPEGGVVKDRLDHPPLIHYVRMVKTCSETKFLALTD